MIKRILVIFGVFGLAGCDQLTAKLGLEDPARKEARLEPEAKAVGSACRQSGRAIEDCYSIYSWLPKAGVFAGWREMDEYMRENKLETVAPQLPPPEPPGAKKKKKAADADAEPESAKSEGSAPAKEAEAKPAEKPAEKH
jgi:hypothetical protein